MTETKISDFSRLPLQIELRLSKRVVMHFRLIPPGSFQMGARRKSGREEPIHLVYITQPFYLAVYPVTQEQFAVWTAAKRMKHQYDFPGNPKHPAESMDWFLASQFCEWLTTTHRLQFPDGFQAGLPSEAQWEYACRAGTETEYYTGDGEAALAEAGWYDGNACETTHPVGLLKHNDFGLYDMHGNVWEWCRDAWDEDAYKKQIDGACDPVVTPKDIGGDVNADRVFRGGSWISSAWDCRAACRYRRWPGFRFGYQGFRVCLFSGPVPQSSQPSPKQPGVKSEPVSGDGA